jgi:FecR protein
MKTGKCCSIAVLVASFAFMLQLATLAVAQDDVSQDQGVSQDQEVSPDQGQDQDPPGRVARLSYSQGSVSFRPAGENDWVTGVPNRPMVTGDDLWTDDDSRAEVHIGSAAIRMGAKTGVTFLALDDRTTQIRLAQGSLILRVRHVDDDDNYEVDTPNLAFTLLQPGEYRLDVSADGNQTIITAWHGRGRVTGGGLSYTVVAPVSHFCWD